MTIGPLAGRRIVVTRPRAQAAGLAAAITAAGGDAVIFPLLDIEPDTQNPALLEAIAALDAYALAVFISPNAVEYSLPAILARGWPPHLRAATVGPGTVKALAARGIGDVICPTERFDSEALLARPEMAPEVVANQRIAIFRGDGGRELLADTLRARGARVDCISCYRRSAPADGMRTLEDLWTQHPVDALTISSSEALRYLVNGLKSAGRAMLMSLPVFVPHARIAESAAALGLQQVVLTAGADAGIIAGLVNYEWPVRP